MAHDVFISYSSNDKPVADALVAGLENQGIRCWVAPRDILPGTSWGQAIDSAIESSKFMVIIFSGNSNRSKQVVREVERGVAHDVIIIPFRIESINPSGAMAYFLATEHWLDAITPPLEEHIQKLVGTIKLFQTQGSLPLDHKQAAKPARPARRAGSGRWAVWLSLAAILLLAAVGLGVAFLPRLVGQGSPSAATAPAATDTLAGPAAAVALPLPPTPTSGPTLHKIGEYRTSGSANGLFISNSTLYVANGMAGLLSLSIDDPSNPALLSTLKAGDVQEAVLVDSVAYLINGDASAKLLITDLNNPSRSATYPATGENLGPVTGFSHIAVADGLAHLTTHNYWSILDVKDPFNPKAIWTWTPPKNSGQACKAVIDGRIAYLACGWDGLFVFDITDASNPSLVGSFETPDWIIDIAVQNKVACLSLGDSGVLTLDVSDPANPLMMDILDLPGFAGAVAVSGDNLYVLSEGHVYSLTVSASGKMAVTADYNELYKGTDIQALNDLVYVTDEVRGVIVLRRE